MRIVAAMIVMQMQLPDVWTQPFQPWFQVALSESEKVTGIQAKTDFLIFKAFENDANILGVVFIYVFQHQSGSLVNQAAGQP